MRGQVIQLDRGYPLVRFDDGKTLRCEHATDLVKNASVRCVIGDFVEVDPLASHEKGKVLNIFPRRSELVRKDPSERAVAQVLAANFDTVLIVQPLVDVNLKRLERELVLAFQTGARVAVVLTKADLLEEEVGADKTAQCVRELTNGDTDVLIVSQENPTSIEPVRRLIPEGSMAVLIGRSGVGKSSLINMLVGSDVQQTNAVREGDGKGKHTTVNREIVSIPGAGQVVDMPGVRGVGMWEAEEGILSAFADIQALADQCRFRDCTHTNEPGCAVKRAVRDGSITAERLDSFRNLMQEVGKQRTRKEESRRASGRKKSDSKAHKPQGKSRKSRAAKQM